MSLIVDIDSAAKALDLENRVRQTPASASIRGIFFRILEDDLARRGFKGWPRWKEILGEQPRSYRLYPVRDLLVAYAQGAALVSPVNPQEGVREIFRGITGPFSESWFGRAFRAVLNPNPLDGLYWLERCRTHVCNYGRWHVEPVGPGQATLHMFDEYFWIDTAHRGGCEGMMKICGASGEVTAELDSPFQGRLNVRWQVRS